MPRHFLVKRHKNCHLLSSYKGQGPAAQDSLDNVLCTTIIDTDKHTIVREGDAFGDYYPYGSPDSGYAASPGHVIGQHENVLKLDSRESNNNSSHTLNYSSSLYDSLLHKSTYSSICTGAVVMGEEDDMMDAPIDLSMPSKKVMAPSPTPIIMHSGTGYTAHRHFEHRSHAQPTATFVSFKPSSKERFTRDSNETYDFPASKHAAATALSPVVYPTSVKSNVYEDEEIIPAVPATQVTTIELAAISQPTLILTAPVHWPSAPMNLSTAHDQLSSHNEDRLTLPTTSPISPVAIETASETTTNSINLQAQNSPKNRKRHWSHDLNDLNAEITKSAPNQKTNGNVSLKTPQSKTTPALSKSTVVPSKKSNSSVAFRKKMTAVRKLNFDIDTTSPVSGTIIKEAADFHPEEGRIVYGDIEPSFNCVEVTPEARAELDKIDNKIGDYICQLCKEFYQDAFQLAQHRCSRIVHVEYRCPECEKVFNCPANLASHRRWHKPRANGQVKLNGQTRTHHANQKIAPKPESVVADKNSDMLISSAVASDEEVSVSDSCHNSQPVSVSDSCHVGQTVSVSDSRHIGQPDTQTEQIKVPTVRGEGQATHIDSLKPPYRYIAAAAASAMKIESVSPIDLQVNAAGNQPESASGASKQSEVSTNERPIAWPMRSGSVIAANPLRASTLASSLTAEERSLVLQVLSSHNLQYQTTTTMSTNTVMTPHVSESFSGKDSQNIKLDISPHIPDIKKLVSNSTSACTTDEQNEQLSPLSLTIKDQAINAQGKSTEFSQLQPVVSPFKCPLCGKKFLRQPYLRKHLQTQHEEQFKKAAKSFTHQEESKVFSVSDVMTSQGQAGRVQINCSVCRKTFSSESARLKHETSSHGQTGTLSCRTCAMNFCSKAALDKHSRSAHATETFACKYCTSMFHSSPGLTRHINKCHPTENRQVILLQLPASRTC
ncbi:serine-rich adhesin for platelets [Biomphalaria pfeifferi]|uniref:Serine-rich adhesin for platelets n=1 Tax=Biomphalaria pfeifferi TaxID=112525 RepID=A0AAD8BLW8_BIOPF|nr:serine-rich adhesin for platelets [Biomphalaria pfeifferi]